MSVAVDTQLLREVLHAVAASVVTGSVRVSKGVVMVGSQQERDLRFLTYVYDNDGGTRGGAGLSGLRDLLGEQATASTGASLRNRGLVRKAESLAGGYHITADGRQVVEELRERQRDRGRRRIECRSLLLRWLDDRDAHDAGTRAALEQFDTELDLLPFTDAERGAAAEYLHQRGLIKGVGGAGLLLVWLTEDGRECLDAGGAIEAFTNRGGGGSQQTIHVTGSNNTISGAVGAHAAASASVVNVDVEAARLFVEALRQVASTMNLPAGAEEVLAEIETSDDPSAVKRALGQLYLFLHEAGAGAAGGVFATYLAAQFGITPAG